MLQPTTAVDWSDYIDVKANADHSQGGFRMSLPSPCAYGQWTF